MMENIKKELKEVIVNSKNVDFSTQKHTTNSLEENYKLRYESTIDTLINNEIVAIDKAPRLEEYLIKRSATSRSNVDKNVEDRKNKKSNNAILNANIDFNRFIGLTYHNFSIRFSKVG